MAPGGHFVTKFPKNKSCGLIWNGEKCDLKWFTVIQNGPRWPFCDKISKKLKLRIDLKWREMRSKVIYGHPKWPPAAILWVYNKKTWKLCIDLKCEKKWFRSSKMVTGGNFVKKFKTWKWHIDLKWQEMRSKVIFGHTKWPQQPFCEH